MSEELLLSDAERRRFAEYCERYATSTRHMLEASRSLPMFDVISRRWQAEIVAYEFVAFQLRTAESMAITKPPEAQP